MFPTMLKQNANFRVQYCYLGSKLFVCDEKAMISVSVVFQLYNSSGVKQPMPTIYFMRKNKSLNVVTLAIVGTKMCQSTVHLICNPLQHVLDDPPQNNQKLLDLNKFSGKLSATRLAGNSMRGQAHFGLSQVWKARQSVLKHHRDEKRTNNQGQKNRAKPQRDK